MHAIGIDYQQTLSVMCLREGPSATAKIRSVGDGRRSLIPNVVDRNGAWGSHVQSAGLTSKLYQKPTRETAWFSDEEATIFWRGLYTRLFKFLGRLEPISLNGYHTVVATQAGHYTMAVEQITRWSKNAGFSDITVIPTTDAFLCRWLSDPIAEKSQARVVVVVLVGDISVDVRAYRVEIADHVPYLSIRAASPIVVLHDTGQAWWVNRLLELIGERMHETLAQKQTSALWDAAIEFGWRISTVPSHQPVTWGGPGQAQLFTPLSLTRHECSSWSEVSRLTTRLPAAIDEAVRAITDHDQYDTVLIGGIGAIWPFAKEAITGLAKDVVIWQSMTPQEDAAWGATCWPEVGKPYQNILQLHTESDFSLPTSLDLPTHVKLLPSTFQPDPYPKIQIKEVVRSLDILPPWEQSY